MNKFSLVFFLIILRFFYLDSEVIKGRKLNTNHLNADVDTFMIVYYGNTKGKLTIPKIRLYPGPEAFDIDNNGCLYILHRYDSTLNKFNPNGTFQARVKIIADMLDFKVFKERIFIYNKTDLLVYNRKKLEYDTTFKINYIKDDITRELGNITYFYKEHFYSIKYQFKTGEKVFLGELNLLSGKKRDVPSNNTFLPINNYNFSDYSFLKEIFFETNGFSFCGQNDNYLLFEHLESDSKGINTKVFVFEKKERILYELKPLPFTIDGGTQRPGCFIRPNEIVLQTYIIKDRKHEKVIYYKLNINTGF